MALDHRHQTVVLRYSASDSLAPRGPDEVQVVLVSADSHEALMAYPELGELLAEAALRSWEQQRHFQVTVVAWPSLG